jgi:tRNA threonylcarbamoyladenosine biosynthesis protein TsaE
MILLGSFLAQSLEGHELVCLEGKLGAGKTVFTKGIGSVLEIREEILSPTFVLQREYRGAKLLLHYDLYRLSTMAELVNIDFFDQLGQPGIKVVEWADRFPQIHTHADWIIKFEESSASARVVHFYHES